jgi:hypothetical protein
MRCLLRETALAVVLALAAAHGAELHVAPSGDDANSGAADAPFRTLGKARSALRALRKAGTLGEGPVTILIHGGRYRVTNSLILGAEDSGTEAAPVIWRAAPGEKVRLVGGIRLTDWQPVVDEATRERLAPAARDHVVQADLRAHGVRDFGGVKPGLGRAELFFNHRYMTLARYPNDGFLQIAGIPPGAARKRPISDPKRPDLNRYDGPFYYSGERPERWTRADDVWMHGYWFHDWSDQHHAVLKFDLANKAVWPKPPYHAYGYRKGQRFYFLNVLEELDEPGEWYLDRKTGLLYFWPPAPLEGAEVAFAELKQPMLVLDGARHVSVRGITFECSRSGAVVVKGGERNEIAGCVVRNVGGTAINVQGGAHHRVLSCDVYQVGGIGIAVRGGDRKTLARGDHVVENCHVYEFAKVFKTYRPGLRIHGVGQRVAHCYVHDCPHAGIGYGGNDHTIEFCEFTRIAEETGDVGVIYTAMDWTQMGHVFRHNYFHHVHAPGKLGCFTIYPDLPCGGIHLYGNVFYDVDQVFHTNSGRGMVIENNLFLRCTRGLRFNVWMDMKKFLPGGNWRMVERLHEVGGDQPLYTNRYPALARLAQDFAKGEQHVLERALPKDNVIRRNVSWCGRFLQVGPQAGLQHVRVESNVIADPVVFIGSPSGDGKSRTYRSENKEIRAILARSGNVLVDGNPGIRDIEGGDFRLMVDSPAHKTGFEPIPFEKIGLYVDAYRRSLPARQPVVTPSERLFLGEILVRLVSPRRGQETELRYTLDGSDPTRASPLYEKPIRLTETTTVRCAAFPVGGPDRDRSQTISATFRAGKLGPEHGIHPSDLPELDYEGYEPLGLMKDHAYQGKPIRLGGKEYARGLITHPAERPGGGRAHVTYALEGELRRARRFKARIGIEDQAPRGKPGHGTVAFAIEVRRGGRWERIFESQTLAAGGKPQDVDVDISGAGRLRLIATDGGDGIGWDHGVWADARIQ